MIISDLIANLIRKFPTHAKTIEAWEEDYRAVLKRFQGDVLAEAYRRVIDTWGSGVRAAFPKPADFKLACRPTHDDGGEGESVSARIAYLDKHLEPTVEKCVQDALRRCVEAFGDDVAGKVRGYVRWHARRLANQYVQRGFVSEAKRDDRWLNGARWKFTDAEIAELKSRADTFDILAGNVHVDLRRTG